MVKHIPTFISLLIITLSGVAQNSFLFVENKGQWTDPFQYRCDIPGGALFLQSDGIMYHFADHSARKHYHGKKEVPHDLTLKGHAYKAHFVNTNPYSHHFTSDPVKYYFNYFKGKNSERWISNVYPKKKVYYQNVWNNIDVHYYTNDEHLKYDFVVQPGGNPASIKIKYEGVGDVLLQDGSLIFKTTFSTVTEQKPFAYQMVNGEKKEIPCAFVLVNQQVNFAVGNYNKNLPLVIDPTLIFSSYTGSTADNFGMTATYDNQGHFYTGGIAYNIGYPTTTGAYETTSNPNGSSFGVTDVVISKFSPDGSSLVYSTYLGGGTTTEGTETVHSLIVNNNDELFLFGVTSSPDFPVTSGAYDATFNGGPFIDFMQNGTNFSQGTDIYVSKFNAAGSDLLGSTFIGGSGNDGVNYNTNISLYDSLLYNYGDQFRGEIMIDNEGNCYVATTTKSSDFPVVNGFQNTFGGLQDAVVFKFDPTLQNLLWSSYLGGTSRDAAYGIKTDSLNQVYVVGGTSSADFPTTPGTVNTTYQGGKTDGFIAKIDSSGNILLRSTLLGTNSFDQLYFIELDNDNDVYVYGLTQNPGAFPVLNAAYSNPNSGQIITKLDSALSTIIYSSQFGNGNGQTNISPTAFLVDICENVYISGWGGSLIQQIPLTGMPVTNNAFQSSSGDGFNFYISVFSTDFDSLVYATYFGGNLSQEHVDGGTSRFDKNGVIYQSVCAGCGSNDDFPTTPGAWSQTNNSSNCNNGVFKLSIDLPFTTAAFDPPATICKGYNFQFDNQSIGANQFYWDFGDGNTSSVEDPTHTFSTPGTYTVTLIAVDTSFITCIAYDTIFKEVTIIDNLGNQNLPAESICLGQSTEIGITAQPGYSYTWVPTTGLSDASLSNPVASPNTSTDYYVLIDNGICIDTAFQSVIVDTLIPLPDFDIAFSASCSGVDLVLQDLSLNADNVIYVVNGDTLAPGDSLINVAFSNTVNITQIATNGLCISSVSQNFTAGGFGDYFDTLIMPNVFTPFVSLGMNDQFCPVGTNGEYCYEMVIYNRWGRKVFESSEDKPCWDGYVLDTYNAAVDGVYFYILNYGDTEQNGFLQLIRH